MMKQEGANKPPGTTDEPPVAAVVAHKFTDDMSQFMAWQNWCWMHYSWSAYHSAMMQAAHMNMMHPQQQQHQQQQQQQQQPFTQQQQQQQPFTPLPPFQQQQQQPYPQQQQPQFPQFPQQAYAAPPQPPAPAPRATVVYKLASIQRRITAESIDFLLLALIKVFVIFALYGDEYIEHFNFILLIDDKTSYDDIQVRTVLWVKTKCSNF